MGCCGITGAPKLPKELEGYHQDHGMASRYLRGTSAGFVAIPALFGTAIYLWVAGENAFMAIALALCGIASLALYIQQRKKHPIDHVRCPTCKVEMDSLDCPVPPETACQETREEDRDGQTHYQTTFLAPDGKSYTADQDPDTGRVMLYRNVQKWYACQACKSCFLAEWNTFQELKEFESQEEAEQFRLALLEGNDSKIAKDAPSLEYQP
jgi:hypothetical protein